MTMKFGWTKTTQSNLTANLKRFNCCEREARTHNSTLAIGGVSSPLDSFVVAESSVLRTNFCGENPPIANLQNVICNCGF